MRALYYQPSTAEAYESIRYITDEVSFGWFFRSMHQWAATFMIAAVILHQMRVNFFPDPIVTEIMMGLVLMLILSVLATVQPPMMGPRRVRRSRHGASMMAPDCAHWHGMDEVAERFYVELIPQAREMADEAAEHGKSEQAEAEGTDEAPAEAEASQEEEPESGESDDESNEEPSGGQ